MNGVTAAAVVIAAERHDRDTPALSSRSLFRFHRYGRYGIAPNRPRDVACNVLRNIRRVFNVFYSPLRWPIRRFGQQLQNRVLIRPAEIRIR
jgi:hypothetical protein